MRASLKPGLILAPLHCRASFSLYVAIIFIFVACLAIIFICRNCTRLISSASSTLFSVSYAYGTGPSPAAIVVHARTHARTHARAHTPHVYYMLCLCGAQRCFVFAAGSELGRACVLCSVCRASPRGLCRSLPRLCRCEGRSRACRRERCSVLGAF